MERGKQFTVEKRKISERENEKFYKIRELKFLIGRKYYYSS
jgi:hypothetical protein